MTRTATTRLGVGVTTLILVTLAGCGAADESAPAPAPVAATAPAATTPAAIPTSAGTTPATSEPDTGLIPAGLLLPDEQRPGDCVSGDSPGNSCFTDWMTDNSPGQAWLLDPCRPTAYPTDAARTSFRTVRQIGPAESLEARQLAVYPSAKVAAEVLAGFRRVIAACSTGTTDTGDRWTLVSADVPDLGDDGLVAASAVRYPPGPGESGTGTSTGNRIAVTRVGSAVFLAYGGGEFSTAELDGGVDDVKAVARRFLDSL